MVNPFFHRGPIRDSTFFFDRRNELERAMTLLRNGQSVSIVGPRRIGKTSFLLQLVESRAGDGADRQDLSDALCIVFLDCQAWTHITSGELYARVASALCVAAEAQRAGPSRPDIGGSITLRELEDLVQSVTQTARCIVFLFDEFDALCCNPDVSGDALCGLRSLAMTGGVGYVTASVKPLQEWLSVQPSATCAPFFNFFFPMRLGLFTRTEAAEMLAQLSARGGRPFAPSLIEWLIGLAGFHPLYLQIAGYCAFDDLTAHGAIETDDADARERIRQHFLDEVAPHWRFAWNTLGADEQHLLATLPLRWQSAPMAVQRLEQDGLIVRNCHPNVTWFSREWQTFISRQPVPGLKQIPPITLDTERRAVLLRGELVDLAPSEFDLLVCLIEAQGRIIPHGELERKVWDKEDIEGGERLKSAIKSLRRCLGDAAACIDNVRGVGYRFKRMCD
jgi:hypothetical protein